MKKIILILASLLLLSATVTVSAFVPQDRSVMVSAQVFESPAGIRLSWAAPPSGPQSYRVYRKGMDDTAWGEPVATLSQGTLSFYDSNVALGQLYEYWVQSDYGNGYICSGIKVAAVENRGTLLLVVENTYSQRLAPKLARLQDDLTGDAWTVVRIFVNRNDTPEAVKALIKAEYEKDRESVKSVFLLGHVPVCLSGSYAPDGHEARPFPADAFYGDMDGIWTDSNGDGIYDHQILPSGIELSVGRVDMADLPAFTPLTEYELLDRYLDKDHAYRTGKLNLEKRGFVHDGFKTSSEAWSRNGWSNFPQLAGGPESVAEGVWKQTLSGEEYLFSYICGFGYYYKITVNSEDVLTTADLAGNIYKTNFTMMFGSYMSEWQKPDNIMRGFLAMEQYGLTNSWGGRPNWFYHRAGMGEAIGDSVRLAQNNGGLYQAAGNFAQYVHVAFLGDPTLRLSPIAPASSLRVDRDANGEAVLGWEASPDEVLGYHVYRRDSAGGAFVRLTDQPVAQTAFRDAAPPQIPAVYMVRAVALQTGASGSYYDQSTGVMNSMELPPVSASVDAKTGKITLFGKTRTGVGEQVTLRVLQPDGRLHFIDQVPSDSRGYYQKTYGFASKLNGTYTVQQGARDAYSLQSSSFELDLPDVVVENIWFDTSLPSGYFQADAVVRNYADDGKNTTLILALYSKEHRVKQIRAFGILAPKHKATPLQARLSMENPQTGDYVKAFVWEGLEAIKALGEYAVPEQ